LTPVMLVLATLLGGVTGFLNVVAGGGSLLSLPFLIFLGLDASSANATNRVGILLQNLVATGQFKREGVLSLRESLSLGIPASIGSVAGTLLAVNLDERLLKVTIALLISFMAFLLISRPRMWETRRSSEWPAWAKGALFMVIGAYGGFLQAGVGFFLIWALAATAGKDLLRANALKASIALCFTVVSFVIFFSSGLINMEYGLALAIGSMAGAWAGTKFSVVKGNKWIRSVLLVMVVISALRMILQVLGT